MKTILKPHAQVCGFCSYSWLGVGMQISKRTEQYITDHPFLFHCFQRGLVNYSALSRQIRKELHLSEDDFDAIAIACRRYYEKVKRELDETTVPALLKKSTLETKTKMSMLVFRKKAFMKYCDVLQSEAQKASEPFFIAESTTRLSVITSHAFCRRVKALCKATEAEQKSLAVVVLSFSHATPRALPLIQLLFTQGGIDVYETISFWTDVVVVIREKDLAKAIATIQS